MFPIHSLYPGAPFLFMICEFKLKDHSELTNNTKFDDNVEARKINLQRNLGNLEVGFVQI